VGSRGIRSRLRANPLMGRRAPFALAIAVGVAVVGVGAYVAYVGWQGSEMLLNARHSGHCATPASLGWAYEAINYDRAEDAALDASPDLTACPSQGSPAGEDVVTVDGVRIAGWYIPSGDGAPPTAPTVIVVPGFEANKSDMLGVAGAVHDRFNVVLLDLRNTGRSTGTMTTGGVLERNDVAAILDWLERTKRPAAVGVLGESEGAAAVGLLARTDPRIAAIVMESPHARAAEPFARKLAAAGHPTYPGIWGVRLAIRLRSGVDPYAADPIDSVRALGSRPLLVVNGSEDELDIPSRNADVLEAVAREAGVPVEHRVCEGARHGSLAAHCPAEFRAWVTDFFLRALTPTLAPLSRTAPDGRPAARPVG
jgi:pimeloyl-ACP methyl ester carboxylesterase